MRRPARNRTARGSPVPASSASTSPFTSKKSTGARISVGTPHCSGNAVPAGNAGERVDFARRDRRQALEARAVLEQADAILLAALVLERRASRPGHSDTRMTDRSLAIGLASAMPARVREQLRLQRRIDEGEGDRFLVAAQRERLEQRLLGGRALRQARGSAAARAHPLSGIASKPTMRATSSIRSASIAMSKRCDGGVTCQPSAVG